MFKTSIGITLIAIALAANVSCKDKNNNKIENADTEEMTNRKENNMKKGELAFKTEKQEQMANYYLMLKDALVKSDSKNASKFAKKIFENSEDKTIKNLTEKIASREDNIETQREVFFELSDKFKNIFENTLTSGTLYQQYCPMAFGGNGGFWFSTEKEIKNPYFGDKMLRCGEVQSAIEK